MKRKYTSTSPERKVEHKLCAAEPTSIESTAHDKLLQSRNLLLTGSQYLQPFIIRYNGVDVAKVYGDLNIISRRIEIAVSNLIAPYLIINVISSTEFSPDGFFYVWCYLNGLGDDMDLLAIHKFNQYLIPMSGNIPPIIPSKKKLTRGPPSAWHYFKMFGILPHEHIIGIYFMSLFPLVDDETIRETLTELVSEMPKHFIPPPVKTPGQVTLSPSNIYPSDIDYEVAKVLPGPPLSYRQFLGESIDIVKMWFKGPNRLLGSGYRDGTAAVLSDGSLFLVSNIKVMSSRMIVSLVIGRDNGDGITPTTRFQDEHMDMRYENGKWYLDATVGVWPSLLLGLKSGSEIKDINFYRCNLSWRDLDTINEIKEDAFKFVPTQSIIPVAGLSHFVFYGQEYRGNIVVMASRSEWAHSLLASKPSDDIVVPFHIDDLETFTYVWNWMNGDTAETELKINGKNLVLYVSYFGISLYSTLGNKNIFTLVMAMAPLQRSKLRFEEIDSAYTLVKQDKVTVGAELSPLTVYSRAIVMSVPFNTYRIIIDPRDVQKGDFIVVVTNPNIWMIYNIYDVKPSTFEYKDVRLINEDSEIGRWIRSKGYYNSDSKMIEWALEDDIQYAGVVRFVLRKPTVAVEYT